MGPTATARHDREQWHRRLRRHRRRFGLRWVGRRPAPVRKRATVWPSSRPAGVSTPPTCPGPPGMCAGSCGRPALGCFGIQRVHFLRACARPGRGRGGRWVSQLRQHPLRAASRPFTTTRSGRPVSTGAPSWRPYYGQAKRVLGVVDNPDLTPADEAMRQVAAEMGVAGHVPAGTRRGVLRAARGSPRAPPSPTRTSAGAGPARRACLQCGECMTGCRHGAKNTLLTNYLHLAERAGAVVMPLTTVAVAVEPSPVAGGWWARRTARARRWAAVARGRRRCYGRAGRPGRRRLRHAKAAAGHGAGGQAAGACRPGSGQLTRTNSESLLGARRPPRRRPTRISAGAWPSLRPFTLSRGPTWSRSGTVTVPT